MLCRPNAASRRIVQEKGDETNESLGYRNGREFTLFDITSIYHNANTSAWNTEQELRLTMALLMKYTDNFDKMGWKDAAPGIKKAFGDKPSPSACR